MNRKISGRTVVAGVSVGVVCFVAGAGYAAEVPVHEGEPSGEFLRTWLLCGPIPLEVVGEFEPEVAHLGGFETDHLAAHGGEAAPRIREGQMERFDGGSATWVHYTSPEDAIDLDAALSKEESVAAYAYCEVQADADAVCMLALGTNDGGRLWFNGEMVWDRPEGRALTPDDDLIPVALRKGRNTVLLKVEERGNKWAFCARLMPFNIDLFLREFQMFRIVNDAEGTAKLRFLQPPSVKDLLLKEVTLEVIEAARPAEVVWQGAWTGQAEMTLPLGHAYGRYVLRTRSVLMDGKELTAEEPFGAGKRVEHMLFDGGKSDYVIVIGTDASESEQWAAQELQHWIKEAGGAELPIRTPTVAKSTEPSTSNELVVGFNERTQALLGDNVTQPDPGDESFTYRNVGPAIVILGGKERGTMYGVFTFLERELGCRWYTPSVTVAPKKARYAFDCLEHSESPGIRVRNDFYYEAFEPIWAARNKINGAMSYREQPGGVEGYWSVHTFYRFMPPSEFFEAHPEYYSLIDGERVHDRAQLCLTNPDVLRIVTERLRNVMRDEPQYLIYSVSQNDWRNPCQCDACQAIVKREGSESGPMIWFVNQVAEAVKEEFPDKYVGTLAYQYTRTPCKTLRPRENVVIRLCSIECCFAHDFHHCPENESFVSDLQGWAAISPHLYIWDYVVNFSHYIMPYPNFRVLQPNIQAFRDNKAIGIMEQAAYQSRGGEFAELRAYVIAKLLWDPECHVEPVINDFMYGYYGRAGQHVRRYFDSLHASLTRDTHIHLGLPPDDPLFSDAFVREAEAFFDDAEAVADDEEIRQRVEMARLPIMYLKCKRAPMEAKYDGTYARFCAIVEREGITHYAERGAPHKQGFHKAVEAAK